MYDIQYVCFPHTGTIKSIILNDIIDSYVAEERMLRLQKNVFWSYYYGYGWMQCYKK